jgi:hypothetical protein
MPISLPQYPTSSGVELWRGPSAWDGAPIVVLATFQSANRKTGNMVQSFILRTDAKPTDAVRNGMDASICGSCIHRYDPVTGMRTCYVNVGQSVNAVYRAWSGGKYPRISPIDAAHLVRGRRIRLGAYGDPAMVPDQVWRDFLRLSSGHTGYTHQWKTASNYRDLCMASVDNDAEARLAWSMGWRTFRVRESSDAVIPGEVTCPASKEGNNRTQCERCMLCSGNQNRRGVRPGIVIIKH